jgi:hypothetical protein
MPAAADQHYYRGPVADASVALASATQTATGSSAAIQAEDITFVYARLNITAASGTSPTLALTLQGTVDGTNWYTVGQAVATQTGVATISQGFPANAKQLRWTWTIGGTTPSFTFAIDQTQTERFGGQAV